MNLKNAQNTPNPAGAPPPPPAPPKTRAFPWRCSPLTRKRIRNFMRIRRAVASLALLTALFLISLASELICNSRPLFLRHNGRSYFPFLRAVSRKGLFGGDDPQPVDYKKLAADPAFTSRPGNRILWAPVPFSPGDVVDARSLDAYRTVRVSVVPEAHVGRLDLLPGGRIVQPVSCAPFFPGAPSPDGLLLTNHWEIPPPMARALAARLAGAPSAPASFRIRHRPPQNLTALASLPPAPARTTPPPYARISFRQTEPPESPFQLRVAKNPSGAPPSGIPASLPPAARQKIAALALACFDAPVPPADIPWRPGRSARVTCVRTEIAWPFPPVKGHWMGIDAAGRDVLARVLYGMRIALVFGIALALWAMCFGVAIGALQGYFGGWVDMAGQRITEIWSALPFLYVMIFIGASLGRSFLLLLICYGLFNWIAISRYMRAEFLRLRQRTFVEAARCQGFSAARIIFLHILPNALTPLITLFPFDLMGAIGALAALDFLGFGLPPMTPSWGELLHQAQQFRWAWWLILFPAAALFTVMLLAVIIGEGLRDAFDPRQQSRME